MAVSLVKRPVSIEIRDGRVLPVPVSLVKRNPVRRALRFYLTSDVLAFVDVVLRADGSVWSAARRRPAARLGGVRTVWRKLPTHHYGQAIKDVNGAHGMDVRNVETVRWDHASMPG